MKSFTRCSEDHTMTACLTAGACLCGQAQRSDSTKEIKYFHVVCAKHYGEVSCLKCEAEFQKLLDAEKARVRELESLLSTSMSGGTKLRNMVEALEGALEKIAKMPLITTHKGQPQDLVRALIQDPWIVTECEAKRIAKAALSEGDKTA